MRQNWKVKRQRVQGQDAASTFVVDLAPAPRLAAVGASGAPGVHTPSSAPLTLQLAQTAAGQLAVQAAAPGRRHKILQITVKGGKKEDGWGEELLEAGALRRGATEGEDSQATPGRHQGLLAASRAQETLRRYQMADFHEQVRLMVLRLYRKVHDTASSSSEAPRRSERYVLDPPCVMSR